METISATELARCTREILDRVVSRGEAMLVERNRVPVACLMPSERSVTVTELLARLPPMLDPAEGAAWLSDSRAPFDQTVPDPWV